MFDLRENIQNIVEEKKIAFEELDYIVDKKNPEIVILYRVNIDKESIKEFMMSIVDSEIFNLYFMGVIPMNEENGFRVQLNNLKTKGNDKIFDVYEPCKTLIFDDYDIDGLIQLFYEKNAGSYNLLFQDIAFHGYYVFEE